MLITESRPEKQKVEMRVVLAVSLALFLWLAMTLNYINPAYIKITNARCTVHNKTWVEVHLCRVRAVNRHLTTLNVNVTVLHPAHEITAHFQCLKKANGYKPFLFNVTVDLCRFLKKPYNGIAIWLIPKIRDFTNFNHSCPYEGTQIVDGLNFKYETIGMPWPTGEYLAKIDWFFSKRKQLSTDVYLETNEDIRPTKKAQ